MQIIFFKYVTNKNSHICLLLWDSCFIETINQYISEWLVVLFTCVCLLFVKQISPRQPYRQGVSKQVTYSAHMMRMGGDGPLFTCYEHYFEISYVCIRNKLDLSSQGPSLFVCFITKSFLTYSFVLPTPTLSTMCRPLSSYTCSITPETVNVGSSYSHMRGPGVGCWLSDRSNCSHWSFEAAVLPINTNIYTDQWEPIVIYHSITLTGRYTTMQPTLLTSWLQLLSYKV